MTGKRYEWRYDSRLQIERPHLRVDLEDLTMEEREEFEVMCQQACSQIPVRIQSLEKEYMEKFKVLERMEEDDDFFTLLNEMNEISSRISDLNVLFLHIEGRFLASHSHV